MHASDQEMEKARGQEKAAVFAAHRRPRCGERLGKGVWTSTPIYRPHPHWSTLVCISKLKSLPAWGLDTSAQETFSICELWPPLADQWLPVIFPMSPSSDPPEGLAVCSKEQGILSREGRDQLPLHKWPLVTHAQWARGGREPRSQTQRSPICDLQANQVKSTHWPIVFSGFRIMTYLIFHKAESQIR